jgi:3-dehydroquinate synthase
MSLHTVRVDLGARSYDVVIGEGALEASAAALKALCPRGRAVIAADAAALRHHRDRLLAVLESAGLEPVFIEVEGGEGAKSWARLEALVEAMLDANMERGEALIAFGGGTVGDLAGFAAAVMKRGCGFIQIPTTLLAQVVSSVGGKTGINTRRGKNLAGAFHQPALVIADTGLLASLPRREVAAGFAEVVKAGLIADRALFERLEAQGADALEGGALVRAIADAVAFKARIVAEDEFESGRRALLNLGHTFAHAFEAQEGYGDRLLTAGDIATAARQQQTARRPGCRMPISPPFRNAVPTVIAVFTPHNQPAFRLQVLHSFGRCSCDQKITLIVEPHCDKWLGENSAAE